MQIVLLANDLMVTSQLQSAAAKIGATVTVVRAATDATRLCSETAVEVVVIDLAMPNVDLEFVRTLKSAANSPRIIAFGPHVHKERLAAARAAGCDRVISRGEFFSGVDAFLQAALR